MRTEGSSTPGSPTESWVLTDCSPTPRQGASGIPRSSHGVGSNSGDTGVACRFDDADVVHLSDSNLDLDLDLDTNEAPFDYEVPFGQPLLHEVYEFEARYPRAAPIIRALLRLPAARGAQQVGGAMASQAQALQQVGAAGAEQVAQAVRFIISEAERAGEAAVDEAWRQGQDIAQTMQRRWPGIAHAMGDGWLRTLADAVWEGSAAVSPLERHASVVQD